MDNYAYQPDEAAVQNGNENGNGRPFTISRYPTNGQNDYLVEVHSRAKHFRKPGFYKRTSILLLILAVLFLIALIVLLVLHFQTKPKTCTSSECLRAATNLKYSMDLSVKPCDDFYQFTCGKWTEEHPNHGWYPVFSTFSTISEKIAIASMKFFESEAEDSEPEALRSSRDFYESCMDVEAINEAGLSVVYKYLKIIGLPIVPSLMTTDKEKRSDFTFNWLKTEAVIKKYFAMDVFLGFLVDANMYNRSENVMYLGTPGQKCPLPSPIKSTRRGRKFLDDEQDDDGPFKMDSLVEKIRTNIIKYVLKSVMTNNSVDVEDEGVLGEAAMIINNITNFMDELIGNHTVDDEVENIVRTFEELQVKTDAHLANSTKKYPEIWLKYVNYLFEDTNVTIVPETDRLYVIELEELYLPKVLKFLLSTPEIHLELYLWWATVYAMIINTSQDIASYIASQTAAYYGPSDVIRTRSMDCSALVNTYMGMAVSYAIADRSFPTRTKPKVDKMIKEIKDAFVEQVNNLQWMDAYTKKVTLEKNNEMISFVGYPDWLYRNGSLDAYYKNIEINDDTFLENMMSILKDHYPEKLMALRSLNERNWSTDPTNVNAFNSFTDNSINIPMAILNFPMYNLGLEVLNYGSIGSILGHELTHGYDNTGRKHDKFGNYVQWWSNQTIETFDKMTECFVEQYNNLTIKDVEEHINGKKTLGENLADNGGVNQAFIAYKKYVSEYGEELKLPGFESYSHTQLFFIAYGSIWCETSTPDELALQIEYDEHAPNMIRVIGALQNSADFAKAFNCPVGSFMNPNRKKCKIW